MCRHHASVVVILAALWACENRPPTQPTPPAACTFVLGTSSLAFEAGGGRSSFVVTTGAGCAWTAVSDRGWMAIEEGASGVGTATVMVSVTANPNSDARAGTLMVAGQPVAVTQSGAEVCSVTIAPSSASHTKDAGTGTFRVTAPPACEWTAVSGVAWVTLTASGGRGDGDVSYAVARNSAIDTRSGTVRVSDQTFTITQTGDSGACEYQVAPVELRACMATPNELATAVTTQPACPWTVSAAAPWITVSGGALRTGSGEVRFRISENFEAPRAGVVQLRWDTPTAGQNVHVSQAGCRYAVSQAAISLPSGGGPAFFDVFQQSDPLECGGPLQNGCRWTAEAGASWITITSSMPRTGDDRVSFVVSPNPGPPRSATIAVRDKVVSVTQASGS
jgi:hypothetical protein